MKHFVALLLFSLLLASTAAAQSTIFLVRHAEKAGGDDPDLTEAGRARAESLANILKDAGITSIYTSEVKRTQETAAPLAKILHFESAVIPAKDSFSLVAKLHSSSANVLVVGHTNTIPEIINALGIAERVTIGDNDYDNLFVVILEEKPRLIRLHYR